MSDHNHIVSEDVRILAVRPGSLDDPGRKTLEDIGVTVIEMENPDELRLVSLEALIPANVALQCALDALVAKNVSVAHDNFARFGRLVHACLLSTTDTEREEG